MSTRAPAQKLDFIEGMRAAAALVVFVNHAYGQTWTEFYGRFPPPRLSFLTYSLVAGHLAVSVFISISGFCLMLPVARGDGTLRGGTLDFFRRRARRILPPYYAALALSLGLIATLLPDGSHTIWDVAARVRSSDVAAHALLVQEFFGTGRINYAFWSIALEWHIYFFFPLLVLLFRRQGPWAPLLGALALGFATRLIPEARIERAHLHYFGLFTMGMVAAWVAFSPAGQKLRAKVPWALIAGVAGAAAAVLMPLWGWERSIARWPALDLLVALATSCALVVAAGSERSLVRRFFSIRPLAALGRFSYSFYLVHAPLLALLWIYGVSRIPVSDTARFFLLVGPGCLFVTGASWLFFRAFEAPFLKAPTARAPVPVAPPAMQ